MNIQKAYDEVELFNKIGGNLDVVTAEKIDAQISVLYEEIVETIDAIEAKDATELLDGAVDVAVVAFGLLSMLQKAGFDVETALERVAANNLTKFPADVNRGLSEYPKDFNITFSQNYQRYVIKDSAGKIRKPTNYKKVVLDDLVNKEFFNQGE